jgi:Raf kinase inhibitor-like YbhB/YbcL family protein
MKKHIFLFIAVVAVFTFAAACAQPTASNKVEPTINKIAEENFMGTLNISSIAFQESQPIPAKYTCQGDDFNPPLEISGVPGATKSLALIMDDPDAPGGNWDHWLLWNISTDTLQIAENSLPVGAVQGANSWGKSVYGGPCPPSGTHRYLFKLYALSDVLSLAPGSDKQTLLNAIEGKVLDQYSLIGLYSKS